MSRERPRGIQIAKALALGGAALLVLIGYRRMNAEAAAMRNASEEVRQCQRLVAEIAQLQELPQFAALEADTAKTIRERIEAATLAARLPAGSLVRIEPQSPMRLGDFEYRVWATRLELSNVTLRQITEFSHALADEQRGLTVRDLRLWSTASESTAGASETWSAEATLTQVTFSPKSR